MSIQTWWASTGPRDQDRLDIFTDDEGLITSFFLQKNGEFINFWRHSKTKIISLSQKGSLPPCLQIEFNDNLEIESLIIINIIKQ